MGSKIMPVILGGDMAAYSIARMFYQAYSVKSTVFSKYKLGATRDSKFIDIKDNPDLDNILLKELISFGKNNNGIKKILFGCGDWYVREIVENRKELEKYYFIPYISENLLNEIVLKDKFYDICEKANVPFPSTVVVKKGDSNVKVDFEYPIILKPSNSAKYHYSNFAGKKKVYKIKTEKELNDVIKSIYSSDYDDNIILQEYLYGDDSFERVLTCYCDKDSDVVFSSLGTIALAEKSPTAIGNYIAIINSYDKKILENAKKFLKEVKYTGVANFDLKYNSKTKEFNFFEINVRLGRSNYYASANGYNVSEYIVNDLIFDNLDKTETISKREHLFTVAPLFVLKKYIEDKKTIEKIKDLKKKKEVSNPIIYSKDINVKRLIYIGLSLINYYIKFLKYTKKRD